MLVLMKRYWLLPLLAFIGIGFTFYAMTLKPRHAPVHLSLPPVSTYDSSIAGIGIIEPKSDFIAVGTQIPGIVEEVFINVGDYVERDTPLFSLDQRDLDASIDTLKSSVEVAQIAYEEAKTQFCLVEQLEDKRAVSQEDYHKRKFAKKIAQARLSEIQTQLAQLMVKKEMMVVKSPLSGTVLDISIKPGEYASAGVLPSPLVLMGDLSSYHVRVEVDQENALKITSASVAKGLLRGDSENYYPLKFVRFEPYIQPKQNLALAGQKIDTRVLKIIFSLEGKDFFVGQEMDVFIDASLNKEGASK